MIQTQIIIKHLKNLKGDIKHYDFSQITKELKSLEYYKYHSDLSLSLYHCLQNISLDVHELTSYSSKINNRWVNPNYDLYTQYQKLGKIISKSHMSV